MPKHLAKVFWELDDGLIREAAFARHSFDEDGERRAHGLDPEIIIRRAKQLERAAGIVRRVRVALETGPGDDAGLGLGWAGNFIWPESPLHPREKLAPFKEEALLAIVHAVELATGVQPAQSGSDIDARFAVAGKVLRDSIDGKSSPMLLRAARGLSVGTMDAGFRRAFQAKRQKLKSLPDPETLARALLDAGEKRSATWTDLEVFAQELLMALGASKAWAKRAFEYRRKREERR